MDQVRPHLPEQLARGLRVLEIGRPILIRPHQVAAARRPRTEARHRRQDHTRKGLTQEGPLQKKRQVAVAVVIAMEEPAFLLPVQRIVRGIQIENDLRRRTPMCLQEQIDE
jgi:hypothetical protein